MDISCNCVDLYKDVCNLHTYFDLILQNNEIIKAFNRAEINVAAA